MKKLLTIMLAFALINGVGLKLDAKRTIVEVHAVGEEDYLEVYDAVVHVSIYKTQSNLDIARGLVELLPADVLVNGISKIQFGQMLDFYQREINEGVEVEPEPEPVGELFKVINGGGVYNGEGYSIAVEDIDVWDDDVYQFRYLKYGTTWSDWGLDNPVFTDIKAGQDKYKVEVRLLMGGTTELERQTGYVEITPLAVKIIVDDKEKEVGEVDPLLTGKTVGVLETSDLEIIKYERQGGEEEVGHYIGRLIATYVYNPNYKVVVSLGDFTITAKEVPPVEEEVPPVDEEVPPVDEKPVEEEVPPVDEKPIEETPVKEETLPDAEAEKIVTPVKENKVPNTALELNEMIYFTTIILATMFIVIQIGRRRVYND